MPDALQMLKDDHRKVQDLFKEFEEASQASQKKRIVTEVIKELEIHTQLEEEIFYPAVREEAEPEDDIMEEAEEEHHVVDVLIAELRRMQPTATNYDAKFKVLSENVKHHIQEEESLMLPKAAELGGSRMTQLGDEMEERKTALLRSYGGRTRNGSAQTKRRTTARGQTTTRSRPAARKRTTRTTASRTARTATKRTRTAAARSGARTRKVAPRTRSASTRRATRGRR
jgi:hypothetical protein